MAAVPGVAVQRLNPRHRDDITRHLLQLPAEDRRLRFGHQIRDEAVRVYADGIDFARDRVFGIQGTDLDLIGVAHLALDPVERVAELGPGEADACLQLDRSAHGGALKEAMADQFALVDSLLKQQYLWLAQSHPEPKAGAGLQLPA